MSNYADTSYENMFEIGCNYIVCYGVNEYGEVITYTIPKPPPPDYMQEFYDEVM